MKQNIKEHGISISLATIATWIPLLPLLWFVGKPVLIEAVSTAMAEDIQDTVKQEVAPIGDAFEVLLQLNVSNLRKEIAALEFRQRQNQDWTADDAETLIETRLELEAINQALASLQNSE